VTTSHFSVFFFFCCTCMPDCQIFHSYSSQDYVSDKSLYCFLLYLYALPSDMSQLWLHDYVSDNNADKFIVN